MPLMDIFLMYINRIYYETRATIFSSTLICLDSTEPLVLYWLSGLRCITVGHFKCRSEKIESSCRTFNGGTVCGTVAKDPILNEWCLAWGLKVDGSVFLIVHRKWLVSIVRGRRHLSVFYK